MRVNCARLVLVSCLLVCCCGNGEPVENRSAASPAEIDEEADDRGKKKRSAKYRLPSGNRYRAEVKDIDRPNKGRINISAFAYRDFNHNGKYDLEEQSMFGVKFMLVDTSKRGSAGEKVRSTNRSGFANFPMSAARDDADIRKPGTYRFVAFAPPGTTISSGNRIQEFTVSPMPGSIGDLFLDAVPKPVGFKARLSISGRLPDGDSAEIEVSGKAEDVEMKPVDIDSSGDFSIPVRGIRERTMLQTRGELTLTRTIRKSGCSIVVSSVADIERQAVLQAREQKGRRVTATFDDLIADREVRKVPNGYRGLDWDNFTAIHNKFSSGFGYHNVVVSGHYAAYSSSGHPGTISSDRPFDFLGGYFTVGQQKRHGETIIFRGYSGEELVYEDEFSLSTYFPTYFQADYLQITRLVLHTKRYWQAAMDDLAFRITD